MASSDCPLCSPPAEAVLAESDLVRAIRDRYPVTHGHTLVVPKRHVESVFDLAADEWRELWSLVRRIREERDEFQGKDANIGVNDGAAAGQTVAHAHVHVIPRVAGDVRDPRGGIRWIVPVSADYWSPRSGAEGEGGEGVEAP
jgi:diadenosine tetraphosphate (Ap4A) HIT family hydrolase